MTFSEKIYSELRKVPSGKITTYKSLAEKIGSKAYQAVGQAMRNNLFAPEVPCHRVVKSDGKVGGFMGNEKGREITRKIKLLASEGVIVKDGKIENFLEILV